MSTVLFIIGLLVGAAGAGAVFRRALARAQAQALTAEGQARTAEARAQTAEAQVGSLREQVEMVRGSREQLRDELKAISADVLRETGESLAQRMEERRQAEWKLADGEMARRTAEIKGLVEPVREKLGRMESEIQRLERERLEGQGQLRAMVGQLRDGVGSLREETDKLVSALKRPATRGAWGEMQLRNVIEMAGMVEHCDFVEQRTVDTGEGTLRPDVLVRLPGGKLVVIDSKVPLEAYLAHLEARDPRERELELARHGRQTREHVAKLASKGYQRQFESSPELVVMFVPSDGIYQAALGADPGLIEFGVEEQVLIATPTTLIGLLRAIHYGWRQELIAESAREIAETAKELHGRLGRFVEPLAKVGRQLGSAVGAYNEAVGSFEGRVMPQVRKLEQAGTRSSREVKGPGALDSVPRSLRAQLAAEEAEGEVLRRGSEEPDPDAQEPEGPARGLRALP